MSLLDLELIKMNNILYIYLEKRFYTENHPKYHKYFKEWISNINSNQIYYFTKEMNNLII